MDVHTHIEEASLIPHCANTPSFFGHTQIEEASIDSNPRSSLFQHTIFFTPFLLLSE
jgi:hypothetical protein